MQIKEVTDAAFRAYGKVIEGIDVTDILEAMEKTPCPEDGTIYTPGDPAIEACPSVKLIANSVYGGMPVQVGYCNGHNKMLNAVEYHRDSEVNIACGHDMVLILGKEQDIEPGFTYDSGKMEAFRIPAGTMVEVYATTLHYAPCHVDPAGFRGVVVLPKGTNTDIEKGAEATPEDKLLFARNKWLISHPEAEIAGSFAGIKGENLSID